jgi:hypothetical protein
MLSMLNFLILLILLIIAGILYRRYEEKVSTVEYMENKKEESLKKYLLNESSLAKAKKPIMWIHIPYEYNARHWQSFGSRSSFDLNQPYLYLTVKSIIKNCEDSFHLCLIDDNTFKKLIPGWKIDLSTIGAPMRDYIRQMAIAKLIYNYGGMSVPISFLCFKNLDELYLKGTRNDKMFICENVDNNITSTTDDFYPDASFMGALKNNETVAELIDFMQRIISSDYTAQAEFLGDFDRWCNARVSKGQINLIDGKEVGTKTMDDKPVLVDDLLAEDYIDFYANAYGIWIPSKMILSRTNYEWFARLSVEQVLEGNVILCKYILLANAPDSKGGVIEPVKDKPDWVSFWKIPSAAPMWGLKPILLGNYVPKEKY